MARVNICYCPWNLELQKSKHPPRVKYGRGNVCYCPWNFKHPPRVKYGRGKHLLVPLELGTAEVQTSSLG